MSGLIATISAFTVSENIFLKTSHCRRNEKADLFDYLSTNESIFWLESEVLLVDSLQKYMLWASSKGSQTWFWPRSGIRIETLIPICRRLTFLSDLRYTFDRLSFSTNESCFTIKLAFLLAMAYRGMQSYQWEARI